MTLQYFTGRCTVCYCGRRHWSGLSKRGGSSSIILFRSPARFVTVVITSRECAELAANEIRLCGVKNTLERQSFKSPIRLSGQVSFRTPDSVDFAFIERTRRSFTGVFDFFTLTVFRTAGVFVALPVAIDVRFRDAE